MPNSYRRDGIFNPHLTTIKDSYWIYSSLGSSLIIFFLFNFGFLLVKNDSLWTAFDFDAQCHLDYSLDLVVSDHEWYLYPIAHVL